MARRVLKPDLTEIPAMLRDRAIEHLNNRDAVGFVSLAGNQASLALVFDNTQILKSLGIYEEALLHAYTNTKSNHSNWDERVLYWMFGNGDRDKFRLAGDALPGPGPFTLYRGVSGEADKRRERGLSWTSDQELAWWFALRYPFWMTKEERLNPAVVTMTIEESNVIAYTDDRNEQEFIVLVDSTTAIQVVAADDGGREAAERYQQRKLILNQQVIESVSL